MKAQDLRVGNYVEINGETYILQDVGQFTVIAEQYKNPLTAGIFEYGLVKGIPLTEEWIIKLGLLQDEPGYYEIAPNVTINIDNHIYSGRHHIREIKYVHQLQNIIYDLTGKELEL